MEQFSNILGYIMQSKCIAGHTWVRELKCIQTANKQLLENISIRGQFSKTLQRMKLMASKISDHCGVLKLPTCS